MEVVQATKHELINRIGTTRFNLWFSKLAKLESRDGTLIVVAADQFLLDRLHRQFGKEIAAAAEVGGSQHGVEYQVDTGLRDESPRVEPQQPPADEEPVVLKKVSSSTPRRPTRRPFERLDSFVVGEGNRVAHTAALAVAERPGAMTPLFLYGPNGSGKTHLLEGIWSAVRQRTARSRVLFLSAEQFTSYFLEGLRNSGLPSFRRKCRDIDLLAIDDVQFFAGKRATIIELQHTVDALLRAGKQLLLAADRPPSQLTELGNDLIARFSGGLICSVEDADYATRVGIAERFARRMTTPPPLDVLELVAAEMGGDARQIGGALNRLEATSAALKQPITPALARVTLQEVFRATQRVVRISDVERAVCDTFGLDPKCLRDQTKAKSISHPRMLAMWLARKHTHAAFAEISQYFGRRSHSTVISAEKKIARWVADGATMQLGAEACRVGDAVRRVEMRLRTG